MAKYEIRAARTHREIAQIMTARGYPMTPQAVYETEQRALRKLRDALAGWSDQTPDDAER